MTLPRESSGAMAEDSARQADTPSSEAPPESRELERLRAIEKAAREIFHPFPCSYPDYLDVLRSALDAGDGQ